MLRPNTRLEHFENRTSLGPAPIDNLRSENNGCKLPLDWLNNVVSRAAAPDHDGSMISLGSVEAKRDPVVHRKTDESAVAGELRIDYSRERPGKINITAGEIENDLLRRDFSHKRRELDVQVSDGSPKLINIGKAKCLGR
jgi:hypothetical protein